MFALRTLPRGYKLHLDYCNWLLFGILDLRRLPAVLTAAATSVSREQFRDWLKSEDPSLHTGLRLPLRTFCLREYTTLALTF